MLHSRLFRVELAAIVVGLSGCAGWAQSERPAEPFPLTKGTYWIYKGTTSVKEHESQVLTCRTEVVERLERAGIVAAVVRGYPVCGEGLLVLIAVDGHQFYLLDNEESVVKRMKDPNDALVDLAHEDDLVLSLPLEEGKRFCEAGQMTRADGMYCWVVEQKRKEKLAGVAGVSGNVDRDVYEISFRTNPDHVFLDFAPGIGIISYQYAHHGTVDEKDLKLVEFHRGAITSP